MWQSRVGAGTLVVRDGRILMICRLRSGQVRWELPSGLVEGSEALEETARREALEETGIHVAVGNLLCTVVMDIATAIGCSISNTNLFLSLLFRAGYLIRVDQKTGNTKKYLYRSNGKPFKGEPMMPRRKGA